MPTLFFLAPWNDQQRGKCQPYHQQNAKAPSNRHQPLLVPLRFPSREMTLSNPILALVQKRNILSLFSSTVVKSEEYSRNSYYRVVLQISFPYQGAMIHPQYMTCKVEKHQHADLAYYKDD
jgi:hypothetical protein